MPGTEIDWHQNANINIKIGSLAQNRVCLKTHKGFFRTNVSLKLLAQIPTMSSITRRITCFRVFTISSKYRINRNIFDHNLFFRSVICEGPTGFEKNESTEILRQIQPGTSSGPTY